VDDLTEPKNNNAQHRSERGAVSGDCVAKLDDKPLARNNRIVAHKFLNQYCALARYRAETAEDD
jgi:hypothetical protein